MHLIDDYGFKQAGSGIMFGLSAVDSKLTADGFTLGDLLTLVGIPSGSEGTFLLDQGTKLQLCHEKMPSGSTLPDPINGMWFFPGENKKTLLTVCAKPLVDSGDGHLIGLDVEIPGCQFSNCVIAVMKQGRLVPTPKTQDDPNDYCVTTGSFCIRSNLILTADEP